MIELLSTFINIFTNWVTMKYFLRLSYKGTNYRGWQRQVEGGNVQEIIEEALFKLTKFPIGLMGCGRTDSGVHSRQFYAHFDYEMPILFDLVARIINVLPSDIVVHELIPVHDGAHARHDADSRTYHYYLHTNSDPMLSDVSSYYPIVSWNSTLVLEALAKLQQRTEFRFLCLTPDKNAHTRCYIQEISMIANSTGTRMMIKFKASRFLKSMIRIIMARVIDLGTGKITIEEFDAICNGEVELKYNRLALPNGLHLVDVGYPYFYRSPISSFLDDGFK